MATRPPYAALRIFVEVAARHSVTEAAVALGVTPGAVSQQIKSIEDRLGISLFFRVGGKIDLTPTGTRIVRNLASAFRQIDSAISEIDMRINRRGIVTVSTLASFAALWLTPRLEGFHRKHPNIEIAIETTSRLVDLGTEAIDLAVRYGSGSYPGHCSTTLMRTHLVPIVPSDSAALIASPKDCLDFPLLHDTEGHDWRCWLAMHGLMQGAIPCRRRFADDLSIIQAVAAGQGIGIVRDVYVREGLPHSKVVPLMRFAVESDLGFHLISRPDITPRPEVAIFARWLIQECGLAEQEQRAPNNESLGFNPPPPPFSLGLLDSA